MHDLRISLLSCPGSPVLGYMLQSLLQQGVAIHSIIMDSKTLSDKDRQIWQERTKGQLPPIDQDHFEEYRIPVFYFNNHSSTGTVRFVQESGIDLLVNAGTPRILKKGILNAPRIGVLNCHPGLLPGFRGCTCVEWAIYLDEEIGNTAHLMTSRIDEGPIILQEGLRFHRHDSYSDIRIKVYRHGFDLMGRAVRKILEMGEACTTMDYPVDGRYFEVIDAEKMQSVLEKLVAGRYAYQEG